MAQTVCAHIENSVSNECYKGKQNGYQDLFFFLFQLKVAET